MRIKNPTDQELLDLLHKDASAGMKLLMDIYSGLIYYIVEKNFVAIELNGQDSNGTLSITQIFLMDSSSYEFTVTAD